MTVGKRTIDRAVTMLAATSAPLLSILTRHHVLTAADAVDIGATIAATIAAYHGGALVERRLGTGSTPTARPRRGEIPPESAPATVGQ